MILGGLASLSNWIIAPTKGMMVAGQDGNLPPFLQRENKAGAPKNLLWVQAVIVSILTLSFLLLPSVNASYWLLTALAAQLYMLMYILMFIAALVLRYKAPHQPRVYKIPGGAVGIWIACGVGVLTSIFVVGIGFVPPSVIPVGSLFKYEALLIIGLVVMSLPPFIIYFFRKATWQRQSEIAGENT